MQALATKVVVLFGSKGGDFIPGAEDERRSECKDDT